MQEYILAFLIGFLSSLILIPILYYIVKHPIVKKDIIIPFLFGLFNVINIYLQAKYRLNTMTFAAGSILGIFLTIISLHRKIEFNVILQEFIISSFIFYIVIRHFNKMFNLIHKNYNSSILHPA